MASKDLECRTEILYTILWCFWVIFEAQKIHLRVPSLYGKEQLEQSAKLILFHCRLFSYLGDLSIKNKNAEDQK